MLSQEGMKPPINLVKDGHTSKNATTAATGAAHLNINHRTNQCFK